MSEQLQSSSPGSATPEDFAALREVEVEWLIDNLEGAIKNLSYPVGCGVAPKYEHLKFAGEKLFERYAKMIEMARKAGGAAQAKPCPGCDGHECDNGCRYPGAVQAASERDSANYKIGWWLSAALEDTNVCAEMKADINTWFEAHHPGPLAFSSTQEKSPFGPLPIIPDDDADFTPDLARKIIAKYQQLIAALRQAAPGGGDVREIQAVINEMIEVATGDDDSVMADWTSDNRADIDKWQSRIANVLSALPQEAPAQAQDAVVQQIGDKKLLEIMDHTLPNAAIARLKETIWKDGIDIDIPSQYVRDFINEVLTTLAPKGKKI